MKFELRDYQKKAHSEIIKAFKKKQKALLVMATGAGKSKTAMSFVKEHQNNYIFIIVVRKRDLVRQLEEDLDFFGVDHGVYMANNKKWAPMKEVQLCSIDTIASREFYPHRWSKKDIVLIIDEADQSKAEQYQALIDVYCNRKSAKAPANVPHGAIRDAFLFGMTATPYNGLSHFDTAIIPIKPEDLRRKGVLVDYKYFMPKKNIPLDDVEVQGGEYLKREVSEKLNNPAAIVQCFQSWLEFGDDRQTLVFCIDQFHAKQMSDFINGFYGKDVAVVVDAKTRKDDRVQMYNDFRNGIIKFLVSVDLIKRGVNIIEIGAILDCAPTLQTNPHIQKMGRGSRANPFYDDCLYIDCASNLMNNGHFYQIREIDLTKEIKRNRTDLFDIQMRQCLKCFRAEEVVRFGKNNICPHCGKKNKPLPQKKLSKAAKEKLIIENATPEQIEQMQMIKEFKKILWQIKNLGRAKYSSPIARQKAHFKLLDLHGRDKCWAIRKTIGLDITTVHTWEYEKSQKYKPLGGMQL